MHACTSCSKKKCRDYVSLLVDISLQQITVQTNAQCHICCDDMNAIKTIPSFLSTMIAPQGQGPRRNHRYCRRKLTASVTGIKMRLEKDCLKQNRIITKSLNGCLTIEGLGQRATQKHL